MAVPAIRILGTRNLRNGLFSARVELKFSEYRDKIVVTVRCRLVDSDTIEQQYQKATQQAQHIIQTIDWIRQ